MMPIWRRIRGGRAADYPYLSSQTNRYGASKGLQSGVTRSRVSRAYREGFETIMASLDRNQSQEQIIKSSSVSRSTDADHAAGQGEIMVVTEVQRDIELRPLPQR